MNAPPVQPGDILARKYRVERVLGAGNMGVVVAATHVDLGQVVALKHMLSGRAAGPEQRERFLREARAAVRLKSHHVARVLDVGANPDEAPYIVMEFLEGQDLDALLKTRGPRPFDEAVEYVLQACEAVGEAHAAGIIHRDLKPANLFLTHDVSGAPCVKVLDFGISKLAGADLALTNDSQSLGSPLYMSPEQMTSSKSVDARSDVWALGIILYQLVAGLTPFHAETVQELCLRVITGQPTPLGHYRPDAPPGLEAAILRCLERERERRYRDVAELAVAIAVFAPAHARVYAERVARVVHGKGARTGSSPDLSAAQVHRPSFPSAPELTSGPAPPQPIEANRPSFPSAPGLTSGPAPQPIEANRPSFPSAPGLTSGPAPQPIEANRPSFPSALTPAQPSPPQPLAVSDGPRTEPFPAVPAQAPLPAPAPAALGASRGPLVPARTATFEASRPAAQIAPPVGGDTGLTLSASRTSALPVKPASSAATRALVIALGALFTIGVPVGLFLVFKARSPSAGQPEAPSSSVAAPVITSPSPAVPALNGAANQPSTASPSPTTSTAGAAEPPTAVPAALSAPAPSSSSAASPPPTVKPSGSKPKPAPTQDLYSR